MLIINQIKLKPGFTETDLIKKISSILNTSTDNIIDVKIERQSIDARKKPDIFYVLSVVVKVKSEEKYLKRKSDQIAKFEPVLYNFKPSGTKELTNRPVIIGAGPAGLFAAYFLAKEGYKPLVLERGKDVDSRTEDVELFWKNGKLLADSNVLFGEGGAGTFSDGKLNTLVKDKYGRNRIVLETFVNFGADSSILYDAKPHVGTDVLKDVVKNLRLATIENGGEFLFNSKVTDLHFVDGTLKEVVVNDRDIIPCNIAVLAIGHSARDTFEMLYNNAIPMEQKDFAVGLRIEHRQDMLNKVMYTSDEKVLKNLPPAYYKLTHKAQNGRGVYSFCMCPGGYVVNASSEPNMLNINGMSYSKRDSLNANSAIVATVDHNDFGNDNPLSGLTFQRELEKKAYELANGKIPTQYYGDYKAKVLNLDKASIIENADAMSSVKKGDFEFVDISTVLPSSVNEAIVEGIEYFDRIIPGFANSNTILSAVETRTSSPVRITRDDDLFSLNHTGLIPCGEGAGYAGGITSAAMDGIRAYEAIAVKYKSMR